jgi:DNA invertase Pin-like site-specific DNA recombinase
MATTASTLTTLDAAPLRGLSYGRVSHDKRGTLRSIEEQLAGNRETADRNGWIITRELSDHMSGSRYASGTRDSWDEAKAALATGEYDVLITWASTRSNRDLEEYTRLRRLCEAHGVLLAYDGRVYDLSNSNDRFTTGMDSLIGERYAEDTRKAVLRALRANAAAGKPHGPRLFGLERTYDPANGAPTGTQVINEAEAEVVREAAARFLAGESTSAIARSFNDRGTLTARGKAWTHGTIRKMLTNPAYAGVRVHRGEQSKANWPAILDEVTWRGLQVKFGDPARRTNRDRIDLSHLLSGVATCGVCGGRIEVNNRPGRTPAYVCRAKGHVVRAKAPVDAFVTELVLDYLQRWTAEGILAEADDPETTAAVARARELQDRYDALAEQAADGAISPTMLAKLEANLLPQIEAANRAARKATQVPNSVLDAAGLGARRQWKAWDDAGDVARQREVLRSVVEVTIKPASRPGNVPFDPETVKVEFKF